MRQEIIISPTSISFIEEDVCILSCAEYPNGICIKVDDVGSYVSKVLGDRKQTNK